MLSLCQQAQLVKHMKTLTPAYGRDYKSAREAKHDYYMGKDFVFNQVNNKWDGMKCSCRDFVNETVTIRYHRQQRVTTAIHRGK